MNFQQYEKKKILNLRLSRKTHVKYLEQLPVREHFRIF